MCQPATSGRPARVLAGLIAIACALEAQVATGAARSGWRRIGNAAIHLALASPATGPVIRVWFSEDGGRLFIRTADGRVFQSDDFETWSLSTSESPSQVRVISHPRIPERRFTWTSNVLRSEDSGRSWTNMTAFENEPVIGGPQRDLAISPADPDLLVVANDRGVWKSVDGGLSWSGLNQRLPNLPVRRILSTPQGVSGVRIATIEGALEHIPGAGLEWHPVADNSLEADRVLRRSAGAALGAEITAVAGSGEIRYAGAADGRIWTSTDGGRSWRPSLSGANGRVERIVADADSRIALIARSGIGRRKIERTSNTGVTWEDITANLPAATVSALAFDRGGRAVYAATERGLFWARVDLEGGGAAPDWTSLSSDLPQAAAVDVRLDPAGNQVYVALEGYGVFAAAAPHRAGVPRLVNAADLSVRAAAPGSLLSVLGARVTSARAGDVSAPVLAASDAESQIQVPFEVTGSSVSMAIEAAGRAVNFGVPVLSAAPAIFVDPDGAPMLLDADSGLLLDARTTARSGSRIQILATGLGRVNPDWPTGLAAPLEMVPEVRARVSAFLDRVPVQVTRATLAPGYIGFYLIELNLPALVNAGPAELYISADGQESNRVRIFLEP